MKISGNFQKTLDNAFIIRYNKLLLTAVCGRAVSKGGFRKNIQRYYTMFNKGGSINEKNLPAQEASEKARARLYEENGNQERQKSARTPPRKGQKKIDLLI